jgi:hypothetical protein
VSITGNLLEKIAGAIVRQGELSRAALESGLAETRNSLRVTGARNRPIYSNTVAWAGSGRLVGWSILSTPGATIRLYDGRDDSGELLAVLKLAAGTTSNHPLPAPGVSFGEALYIAADGPVEGSLYLGAHD